MSGAGKIRAAFTRATDDGRSALLVFLAAGDPDHETTLALARASVEAGADIVELGVPFSDPLADGPVIQAAYTRALEGGATIAGTLACAGRVAAETDAPVVLMVAYNCILASGEDPFCRAAAEAGVSGILVPDLPLEDADTLRTAAESHGLGTVFLVAPDSGPARVAAAAAASTGFVYLLRRRGITGSGEGGVDLPRRVAAARGAGSVPVAVGFGISTAEDVAEVAGEADGVIVGSALVQAAFEAAKGSASPEDGREAAARGVGERVRALSAASGTRGGRA